MGSFNCKILKNKKTRAEVDDDRLISEEEKMKKLFFFVRNFFGVKKKGKTVLLNDDTPVRSRYHFHLTKGF